MTPRQRFFSQAEDGIRARNVTGVQTCALPIYAPALLDDRRPGVAVQRAARAQVVDRQADRLGQRHGAEIGRASCRERVEISVGAVASRSSGSIATAAPSCPGTRRSSAAATSP